MPLAFFGFKPSTAIGSRQSTGPNAEEFTTGRLDGSEAHRPIIRVSLNAAALGSLQNGRLAPGAKFAEGSIVLKELRSSATATTSLSGSVAFSVSSRGSACTSCHRRQQGPQNDLARVSL